MPRWTYVLPATAVLMAVFLAGTTACSPETQVEQRVGVVVTIPPQAEFVERVGGGRVDITVMVPPGASPHTYEPTSSQMASLGKARMYAQVGSGVEFELVWLDKLMAINDKMETVDCSKGIELVEIAGTRGDGAGHERGAMDPHIWMSPLNARTMVENITEGLVKIDPDNKAYYQENRDVYVRELTRLDQDIRNGLSRVRNRRFMVYHPVMGYFARDYGLTMMPIEEEGKEPTAAGLAHLIEQAKEHNIKVVFASPQFNLSSARVIVEAIGGRVVFVDPLAREYVTNLRSIVAELVQAME